MSRPHPPAPTVTDAPPPGYGLPKPTGVVVPPAGVCLWCRVGQHEASDCLCPEGGEHQWAPEGLRDRKAASVRVALESATVSKLTTGGYEHARFEDIAAMAGVSARTAFRYYPTKDDLVLDALRVRPVSIFDPDYTEDRIYPHPRYELIARCAGSPGFLGALVERLANRRPDALALAGEVAYRLLTHPAGDLGG